MTDDLIEQALERIEGGAYNAAAALALIDIARSLRTANDYALITTAVTNPNVTIHG